MTDFGRGKVVGGLQEGLGEGKRAFVGTASTEFAYEFTRLFRKPGRVNGRGSGAGFLWGKEGPDGGCVVHVLGEECGEFGC